MINIKKLFNKAERGTHKGRVKVTREGKTFIQIRALGRKPSSRAGTGKLEKFPESIKNKILELRNIGYSGAKIKNYIENMITQIETGSPKQENEINLLNEKIISLSQKAAHKNTSEENKKDLRSQRAELIEQEGNLRSEMVGEIKTHIEGKSTDRDLIKEGLINKDGKLTVTSQALTNWAKTQGIESAKKRTSAVDAEKVKHESTKKDLEQADKKIVRLEVTAKHNLEEIKLVQQSKQESDRIRQNLGKENKTLSEKLKACLRGK